MNRTEFARFKQNMNLRGMKFDWQRINCVRHHSSGDGETWKHYWLKCLTGKILNDCGHTYFTEFEFPNKATCDVYDATDNVVIEFETQKTDRKEALKLIQYNSVARDCFVIRCKDISNDIQLAEKEIRRIIGV